MIIGIAGQKRNGKDTVGEYILQKLNGNYGEWRLAAFAAKVKQIFKDTFGVDDAFIEEWKTKDEIPPGFNCPVRNGLQKIGNGFREIQSDIWIKSGIGDAHENKIIVDCRYFNEMKAIQNVGLNILVYRKDYMNDDPCPSEAELKPLIRWFLDRDIDGAIGYSKFKSNELNAINGVYTDFPEPAKYVSFFIQNTGDIEELHDKLDKFVMPYLYENVNVSNLYLEGCRCPWGHGAVSPQNMYCCDICSWDTV